VDFLLGAVNLGAADSFAPGHARRLTRS